MKHADLPTLFHVLRKQSGRLLGLDLGEKYVGVAVSNHGCSIAFPESVIVLKPSAPVVTANALEILVQKYSISGFVIGYPISLAGLRNKQVVKADDFIKDLHKRDVFENIHYFLEDERFTSVAVSNLINDLNIEANRKKRILDKFAAVCILQGCLDRISHYADKQCRETS